MTGRLLYVEDAGGTENHQLYLLDADRGQVVALSEGYEDAMHLFGAWRDDGRQIVFAANRRDPAVFDLYVQEMDGMVPGPVVMAWQNDVRGYLRSVAISPDHRRVTLTRTASSFSNTLLEIDLATGQARELVSCDEPVRFSSVAYTGDGLGLFLITDLGSDYLYVAKFDLATGVMDNSGRPGVGLWRAGGIPVCESAGLHGECGWRRPGFRARPWHLAHALDARLFRRCRCDFRWPARLHARWRRPGMCVRQHGPHK